MTDSRIYGKTFEIIGNSLDVSARRHNLITGNIANMDTVGYKPKDLDFKKTLERMMDQPPPQEMSRTHGKHLPDQGRDKVDLNGSISEDVDIYHLDSVNIDTEMVNLVENNIKYRSTTEMLLRKMAILKYSIDEGGR
ncbi:MAG: flagellar basal body rod protein FlgB [Desulfobacteraceae bacterium]|nr:MAG: flagellar basal body rod protein FlgB [Desulfobacteraceae bacterium]